MNHFQKNLPGKDTTPSTLSNDGINHQKLHSDSLNQPDLLLAKGKYSLKQGDTEAALVFFKKAYAKNTRSAESALNYALTLFLSGKMNDSIKLLTKIVSSSTCHPDVIFILAYVLTEYGIQQKSTKFILEAVHYYTEVLSKQPKDAKTWNNLGMCLLYLQKTEEAERCFMKAIQFNISKAIFYNNIAMVARLKYLPALSAACCEKAIGVKSNYPEAYNNLGNALKDVNDLPGAKAAYQKALCLRSTPEFRCNLAMVLLAMGDFKAGWELFESRTKIYERQFQQHQWRGEPAAGKTILIYDEQGFGDTIQFCRYISLVKKRGASVLLKARKPLRRLLKSVPGVDAFVENTQSCHFDFQCPMMSLPLAFHTDLTSLPSPGPYLFAARADVQYWQDMLADTAGLKVGLAWSGQAGRIFSDFGFINKQRSIPVSSLLPLLEMEGIRFFNLQKDGPPDAVPVQLVNYMEACHDFADTAALIMNLDLVIAVDTAVAHLAGALGKPVWVLNRFSGCWRWLRNRDDSPWYPTLRLFTQTAPGDWSGVIDRVKHALAEECRKKTVRPPQNDPKSTRTGVPACF